MEYRKIILNHSSVYSRGFCSGEEVHRHLNVQPVCTGTFEIVILVGVFLWIQNGVHLSEIVLCAVGDTE